MEKYALDRVKWLEQHPEATQLAPIEFEYQATVNDTNDNPEDIEAKVNAAIAEYELVPSGGRHLAGYTLVCRLLRYYKGDLLNPSSIVLSG